MWPFAGTYPQFMDAVEQVDQLDDTTLRWRVAMAGATRGFVADITTQEPDLRRFKDFIEYRGRETGAWRGSIHDGARDEPS